ncbi:MAG: nucleoside kinase [Treponema sp.]|jgi:uridine kinase|nr:nucleoside kinase [Treponema sp.]
MKNTITVQFRDGKTIKCPTGSPAEKLTGRFGDLESPLAAVKVNNRILPLSFRLEVNASLEPVTVNTPEGAMVNRRSLAFVLSASARELFPGRSLLIGHSLGSSYYYTFQDGKKTPAREIKALSAKMEELISADLPISAELLSYTEAAELFEKQGQDETVILLERRNEPVIWINRIGDFVNLYIEPLLPRTGILSVFELMVYEDGFLLRFPRLREKNVGPFEDSPKIFAVYKEYKKWGRIVGVHSAGELNRLVRNRTIKDFIRVAEAFQAKKMSEIADQIYRRRNDVKAILIAGPSSSGKTTTAKRLSIDLMVMGIEPIAVSLDDYYVGTALTPLDENGKPDFECLEALDIPFLNEQLISLFNGEEVSLPAFDFKAGTRREGGGKKIRMNRRSMLIVEGIHGLNDKLTPKIARSAKFKLYVSALTQINLDDYNRVPASDNRLLRRMVRDSQFRGAGADWTIRMWPSVQRGERKHIFTFQDSADAAFNSALDYEISVLKFYAEPLLRSVKPNQAEYAESSRLLDFLENFSPILPQYVPGQSILREFIGESEFKY